MPLTVQPYESIPLWCASLFISYLRPTRSVPPLRHCFQTSLRCVAGNSPKRGWKQRSKCKSRDSSVHFPCCLRHQSGLHYEKSALPISLDDQYSKLVSVGATDGVMRCCALANNGWLLSLNWWLSGSPAFTFYVAMQTKIQDVIRSSQRRHPVSNIYLKDTTQCHQRTRQKRILSVPLFAIPRDTEHKSNWNYNRYRRLLQHVS